ncbi:ABC transporter ATP-binding protein [Rhizobium miluonense]|uniref:Peptide/nickel transport system ATP-binding protein n=1 Tax=Rhizobium miluonense TaxID=411945 RepID=A0A1C3WEH0_9HYPH|nr:ABC transporter ATP-binding protein [Rhizobium miluonense]SCB38114.1 peptide/nickel transport system ATP-binding protein [Rhizobium miluonense]
MNDITLELRDISRRYVTRQGLFGRPIEVSAVDAVSLVVPRGQTLGIVGESGSGKSTTGRVALGLEKPDGGEVLFQSKALPPINSSPWRRMRRRMQMIYQDPLGALDRQCTILRQIREPLDIHGVDDRSERDDRAYAILKAVGLNEAHGQRYPHELSGGQRQRAVLARALITRPELLVCDEPVSALDVSIQAQVVNLLVDLQEELNLSLLFISHDLKVVRHISHRMAVMYLGRIVESGDTDTLISAPAHPYTQALVSAVPVPGNHKRERVILSGEPPNPAARPSGCAFHPRCPVARSQCRSEAPSLQHHGEGHLIACHVANERLARSEGRN